MWGVYSQEEMGPLNQLVLSHTHFVSITLLKAGIKYYPAGHFSAASQKLTFSSVFGYVLPSDTQLKEFEERRSFLIHYMFLFTFRLELAVHCSRCPVENSVLYPV